MPEAKVPSCGRWRLLREIGRGAYGVVYLATDPGGETRAVKSSITEEILDINKRVKVAASLDGRREFALVYYAFAD